MAHSLAPFHDNVVILTGASQGLGEELAYQLADESARQGLTARRVSDDTIRRAILRLGSSWKRAKRWITSPDPAYQRKKGAATS